MREIFFSKTAAAIATWLTLASVFFAVLVWLTPAWFGALSWSQAILLGIAGMLTASVAIAGSVFVFAIGYRRLRPLPPPSNDPKPADVINTREKDKIADLRRRVKQLEDDKAAPEPAPDDTPKLSLTAEEKRQAKDILVELATLTRDRWVPLFDSGRWLYGAQDVYARNLDTLPALKKQANEVVVEIHDFQQQQEHMLNIMGLGNMVELGRAAGNVEGAIQNYIGRVTPLGDQRSNELILLLQGLAQPVRDAFAHYNSLISSFQRTITRMRKEIDA